MDETNFDWDDLRLFLAVARSGGLGPASKSTSKSAPTLGRRMLSLERQLGQDLFVRNARGYALTKQGETLLIKVEELEERLLPILEIDPTASVPLVKISAGTWVTRAICEAVNDMSATTPVRFRFISAEAKLDIGRREAAIGVRNARPTEAGLAGKRVGPIRFAAYATKDGARKWISVLGDTPSARWVKQQRNDEAPIEISHASNALDLALAGAGCAVLPTFIGENEPRLVRTTPIIKVLDHDQWLVTHHEDRFLPEVRAAINAVYAVLKDRCVHADQLKR